MLNKDFYEKVLKREFVTPEKITMCDVPDVEEYKGYECFGCGRTAEQINKEDGWTDFDFEECSRTTVEGNWYCHIDCFRDSR
jgi:hypothetical protein